MPKIIYFIKRYMAIHTFSTLIMLFCSICMWLIEILKQAPAPLHFCAAIRFMYIGKWQCESSKWADSLIPTIRHAQQLFLHLHFLFSHISHFINFLKRPKLIRVKYIKGNILTKYSLVFVWTLQFKACSAEINTSKKNFSLKILRSIQIM